MPKLQQQQQQQQFLQEESLEPHAQKMLENVEHQHEMSVQEFSQFAKRMQETVVKQESF